MAFMPISVLSPKKGKQAGRQADGQRGKERGHMGRREDGRQAGVRVEEGVLEGRG